MSARRDHMPPAWLEVDLSALVGNWQQLDALAPGAETAGVVKANAYGTGIRRVAPALAAAGCRTFFTATLDEALGVRAAVRDARVMVLNGLQAGAEADYLNHDLTPVLNSLGDIERWQKIARFVGHSLAAAIHLDTGMTRLGLLAAETDILAAETERLDGIDVALWLTHPACADLPGHPLNAAQLEQFRARVARLPAAPLSFCNSPAIHLGSDYHLDLTRPGVAVYGGNCTPAAAHRMQEVIHLKAKILQVHHVDTPMTVGYGATHPVAGPGRLATVGVGYGDGYLRALSGKAYGILDGHRVPLAGRVSMDLTTFDISGVPEDLARPGAEISMIGGGVDIDELAGMADTISYELLSGMGPRLPRFYSGEPVAAEAPAAGTPATVGGAG